MTKYALVASTLILASFMFSLAHAQVTVEFSKITCEEFATYKVADPEKIATWLSGYYHGRRSDTSIDQVELNENTKKLEEYCLQNSNVPVMQAYDNLFGVSK